MTDRLWRFTDHGTFEPLPVTRATDARVYFFDAKGRETFVTRKALASGSCRSRAARCTVFTDAGREELLRASGGGSVTAATSAALAALGLSPPCSSEDVQRAFRIRARDAHPDAGGSATAFIELVKARDRALKAAGVGE